MRSTNKCESRLKKADSRYTEIFKHGLKTWFGNWFETLRILGVIMLLYLILGDMYKNKAGLT